MFGKNFYPTPSNLASKIRNMVDWKNVKNICDPSMGKGDLLLNVIGAREYSGSYPKTDKTDILYIWSQDYYENDLNFYGIEIDPVLRAAASKIKLIYHYNSDPKKINIIGSDFLTYDGDYSFDLLVINPPFDTGVKHILKAWEIVKNCQIFCILNKETVENLFSKERKLLNKIIEDHGQVENIGRPFIHAERTTGIECVLVKLVKKEPPKIKIDFSDMPETSDKAFAVDFNNEKFVVQDDELKARVERFKHKIRLHRDVLQSVAKFHYYGGSGFGEDDYEDRLNAYIRELTMQSWQAVVDLPRFCKYMTSEVKEQFDQQIESASLMEFTVENILSFLDMLVYSFEGIMEHALVEVFEHFTAYDKRNRIHTEGWWTNDSYKVNRKVIIPNLWGYYAISFSVNYEKKKILDDIDRVMIWLSGEQLHDANNPKGEGRLCPKYTDGLVESITAAIKDVGFGELAESHFFSFRVYKKGTLHLTFKDEKLWQEFNLRAAEKKNWLPDDYKARRKEYIKKGLLIEKR